MHDHKSSAGAGAGLGLDQVSHAVLGLLVTRHPELVAVDELVRQLAEAQQERPLNPIFVYDAVADLVGDGLVHRLEGFVVATRAAVRAAELAD